jgi:predicted rRNA methylase YqxC with S4 and FtsJ domains
MIRHALKTKFLVNHVSQISTSAAFPQLQTLAQKAANLVLIIRAATNAIVVKRVKSSLEAFALVSYSLLTA